MLIGSLAKLPSSFYKQSVLASCRWLMLSLARWSHQWLLFGFKVPRRYLTLSCFSTKNEVMLQLTILVVLNCIMFWIEPFAYRVCCVVLDHVKFWIEPFAIRVLPYSIALGSELNFCYQSLALLNSIRSGVDPLLLEQCKKFSSPLAYASGQSHSTYFTTWNQPIQVGTQHGFVFGNKTRCLLWPRSNRTHTMCLR